MKNHHILFLNSLVLILVGIIGYLAASPALKSLTAFIGPLTGIILLFLYSGVKNQNHTVTHIMVAFTLVTGIFFMVVGVIRGNILIIISASSTLLAVMFYVMDFLRRKKERKSNKI